MDSLKCQTSTATPAEPGPSTHLGNSALLFAEIRSATGFIQSGRSGDVRLLSRQTKKHSKGLIHRCRILENLSDIAVEQDNIGPLSIGNMMLAAGSLGEIVFWLDVVCGIRRLFNSCRLSRGVASRALMIRILAPLSV